MYNINYKQGAVCSATVSLGR